MNQLRRTYFVFSSISCNILLLLLAEGGTLAALFDLLPLSVMEDPAPSITIAPRKIFSSFSLGLDLIFLTPPDWIFSKVDCDKLDLIKGDFEFFLNSPLPPAGDRSFEAAASLEVDLTLGVDSSLEADINLGDEVLADILSNCPDSFF